MESVRSEKNSRKRVKKARQYSSVYKIGYNFWVNPITRLRGQKVVWKQWKSCMSEGNRLVKEAFDKGWKAAKENKATKPMRIW